MGLSPFHGEERQAWEVGKPQYGLLEHKPPCQSTQESKEHFRKWLKGSTRQEAALLCVRTCCEKHFLDVWKAFAVYNSTGALSPAEPGPQLTCTEHWRLFTALSCALAYIQSQLDLGAFPALMLHFLLEQNPTSLGSTKPQTGRINSPCSYLTLAEVL